MITTFQALLVTLLALLPGASYTFAFERVAGAYGITLSDRIFRFLAASAVLGALASGPAFTLYRRWIASGQLARGEVNSWHLELLALGYVIAPIVIGSVVGRGAKRRWRWLVPFVGESPEPRAWDHLWRAGFRAVVRIKLKSGTWVAGIFGASDRQRSYASGYPEAGDLFLSLQLRIDADSGDLDQDGDGSPVPLDPQSGLLLRWAEVEFLEVQEF